MYSNKMAQQWAKLVPIAKSQFWLLMIVLSLGLYSTVIQPQLMAIVVIAGLLTISVSFIGRLFPHFVLLLNRRMKLRLWHLVMLFLSLFFLLGLWIHPAQAQFFNSLQEALTEVINEADLGIDEGIITGIFTFFRVLIVLSFIVGVVVVFVQAMRGSDWQPIANLVAIGVAFVIGVEVITRLMLGGG